MGDSLRRDQAGNRTTVTSLLHPTGTDVALGKRLREWRKSQRLKQGVVAEFLGVSQVAVSNWERGFSRPSPGIASRIENEIFRSTRETDRAVSCIRFMTAPVVLFDLDSVSIRGWSRGTKPFWPEIDRMAGIPLRDRLVNESRLLIHDPEIRYGIETGDIYMVQGISAFHVDLDDTYGKRKLHAWNAIFRDSGAGKFCEMHYMPCARNEHPNIGEVFRLGTS